jgi:hypothetical protein
MELQELLDRCLYEDELREILSIMGERPDGAKAELIARLISGKHDKAEIINLIDEDILSIVCLESGVPTVGGKEELVRTIIEDVLGEMSNRHDPIPQEEEIEGTMRPAGEDSAPEEVEIGFDELVNLIGVWQPVTANLTKRLMINELDHYLREHNLSIRTGITPDIIVGRNIPLELMRGKHPQDVDLLVKRMLLDLEHYGKAIGLMFGVEEESIVEGLEKALDAVVPEQENIAIVLI